MTEPSLENVSSPEKHPPTNQQDKPMSQTLANNPPKKIKRLAWLLLGLGLGSIGTLSVLPYLPLPIVNQLHLPTLVVMQPMLPSPPLTPAMVQDQNIMVESLEFDKQALHNLQASMDSLQQRLNSLPTLKEGMQTLSQDLQALHANQTAVRAAQINIESMQLHSRLSWVLHASSHLPQIRLAWEEIVLLPSLHETQRQQANEMLLLAQQRSEDIYHWQQELDRVLASYYITPVSSHNFISDWLPYDGALAPISTWLSQQFHLQKAQRQDAAVQKLRQQITRIQQNMSLEIWPDAQLWKSLRSRLQLHMLHDDAQHQALSLPEDFSPIQSDIELLRNTARDWLQESSK